MAVFGIAFVSDEDGTHKNGYDTVDGWDVIDAREKFKQQHPKAHITSVTKVSE